MLTVQLLCVGKLKEKYLREGCGEFIKRLGGFCRLRIDEIEEARLSDHPSQKEIDRALAEEGRRILAKIPAGSYVAAMCIEGKQLSSMEFSKRIEQLQSCGMSTICFIIGGSFGLSDEVKSRCDWKLSVSQMTFPHQLFRLMLLEQIYRALNLMNHGKYHK